jgi:NAD-dependent deacetylase
MCLRLARVLDTLAKALRESRQTVVLTGAGVSTESGIPDFRSDAGMWGEVDPMDVASAEGYATDTARFYRFWSQKFGVITTALPGPAHRFLADLEAAKGLSCLVTQNIDGLHQKAGSQNVVEAHGSFRAATCLSCGVVEGIATVFERAGERAPKCRKCGGRRLKPGVVLFGEMLPAEFAQGEKAADEAEVLVAMGSSLGVYPVAGLVARAIRAGARTFVVNRDDTPFDDEVEGVVRGELKDIVGALRLRLDLEPSPALKSQENSDDLVV